MAAHTNVANLAEQRALERAGFEATARNFQLESVMADKAYSSRRNLQAVSDTGATPYIPFRRSFKGGQDTSSLWHKAWHFYHFNRDEFLRHYHKRSNAESTFNMIKAKFGSALRSKTDTALVNEALAKVLCHNLCVVIQSMHELGIDPSFESAAAG